MLRLACAALAISFLLPIVYFHVGESTSTSHVGATGATGYLKVGVYRAFFKMHTVGGGVNCDFPNDGDLLYVEDNFCDVIQISLPVMTALLVASLLLEAYFKERLPWYVVPVFADAATLVVWISLFVAVGPGTYKNTGEVEPLLDWGGAALLTAGILIPLGLMYRMYKGEL